MNAKTPNLEVGRKLYGGLAKWGFNDRAISVLAGLIYLALQLSGAQSSKEVLAEITFLANYALLIAGMNYWLVPRFFYQGKYGQFLLMITGLLLLAGFLEEGVIEKVFYPNSRGNDAVDWDSMLHVLSEILPIAVPFFGFKLAWDYRQEQRRAERLSREKLNSELKFLKSQINPHVLFNNLNNIYSYSLEEPGKVPPMILKLSDIMRYMLYECEEEYVPLRKELEYLENYIELQKIQMEGRGEVRYRVAGEAEGYHIAPLLLIAFVENCFKHSMHSKVDGIEIEITIRIMQGVFDFFAENNFSKEGEVENKVGGVGLDNVQKRLELLYPGRYELHFQHSETSFRVNLRLSLV